MTMKPWRLILFELGSVPHGSPGTKAGCPGSLLHDQVGSAWQLWKKKTWLKSLSKINGNSTCETNTMLCQLSLNKKNFFFNKQRQRLPPDIVEKAQDIQGSFLKETYLGSPSNPDWLLATGWGLRVGSKIREVLMILLSGPLSSSRDGAIKTRMNSAPS